jgi:ketosteroid isomerase-like protein
MSQENVEIVRRGFAGFAESGSEGVIPFYTEDAIIYSIPEWPDDPEYHGHDGVRKLTRQWRENFDDFGLDLRELHDGGATVVALFELTGQTKGSALPMRMQIGAVFSGFTDGRIGRQRLFSSWELALEAAGLREEAMSQENVEIVRRVSDAYNRRDVGAMLDELHPEIEWHPWLQLQFGGGATVYRGHQGVRKGIRELEEAFSEIQAEQTEIRDLGERVVAIGHLRGRGSESGAITESAIAWIVEFKSGKVIRVREYLDPKKALEAVGLSGVGDVAGERGSGAAMGRALQ